MPRSSETVTSARIQKPTIKMRQLAEVKRQPIAWPVPPVLGLVPDLLRVGLASGGTVAFDA